MKKFFLAALVALVSCGSQKTVVKEQSHLRIDSTATENVAVSTDSVAHNNSNTSRADSSSLTVKETYQSVDTTFEITTTETTWYDTQRTDTNGHSPIAKREVRTTLRKTGKSEAHTSHSNTAATSVSSEETEKSMKASSAQVSAKTATVAKELKSKTDAQQSRSESKQTKYIAMILYGLAAVIFVSIVAYVVIMAYRARDQT